MAIEFHCTQCHKLLRSADEMAGRTAKCPACGNMMSVPTPLVEEPIEAIALSPMDEPVDAVRQGFNPYQAPGDVSGAMPFQGSVSASERVRAPAICLMVVASVGLLTYLGCLTLFIMSFLSLTVEPEFQKHPEEPIMGFIVLAGYSIIGLGMNLLALFGAIKMQKLKGYGLAMTGAVFMVIPFLSPCFLLGIPFGIWAIFVLADSDVRNAFQ